MSESAGSDRRPSSSSYESDVEAAVYVISVAAELSGMHPQTLRQYDRLGLVSPGRSSGRGRRYSLRDIAVLREVQRLSQEEGVNLAGIKRILELEAEVDALRGQVETLVAELRSLGETVRFAAEAQEANRQRYLPVAATGPTTSGALVIWRPGSRRDRFSSR
jgi:MerR family transcriptional regulator/heat shock protein HspR